MNRSAWPKTVIAASRPARRRRRSCGTVGGRLLGKLVWVPDRLPRLDAARALAVVELPLHLNWSTPGRVFDLGSRADRARVYEIVLQEGRPADILAYVDGALLADLWDDLVLPRAVRSAWSPVIQASGRAAV